MVKLSPQPQAPLALGLSKTKPAAKSSSTQSIGRADQIEDRGAVDIEGAARRFDLLVELRLLGDVIDRISEARAAAARGRQLDADRALGRARHQLGDPRLGGGGEGDGGGAQARGHQSIPNSSRASSDIFCGSQGGSQTSSTSASPMPGTAPTRSSTSPGMDSATGQCGVVSVIFTLA